MTGGPAPGLDATVVVAADTMTIENGLNFFPKAEPARWPVERFQILRTRLERHRMINATLAGELAGGIHALAIHAAAPGEGGV